MGLSEPKDRNGTVCDWSAYKYFTYTASSLGTLMLYLSNQVLLSVNVL